MDYILVIQIAVNPFKALKVFAFYLLQAAKCTKIARTVRFEFVFIAGSFIPQLGDFGQVCK